ncbi:MAG TPA: LacI family DNA-binding transcriptional regulator [Acidobacteriaceae bacterium]|jgi:LacI family transcriptional regulator|nr:LacI family DNA-binding transcriptional regulator [Acidobacteriaceae bacterium]
MSTIVEVAKLADVSIATVSNVIRGTRRVSPKLTERVQAAIHELNYSPNEIARSLKVRQTRMLAMVLPDITNPFFPEIIRGAEDTAFGRGYFLVTANTDEQIGRERRIVAALRSYRVDGVLLAPASGTDTSHLKSTIDAGVALVCLDRTVPGMKTDAVLLDNARGAHECVRHMIQRRHRRIAIITGSLDVQTGRERLRGYEEALRHADIPVDKGRIFEGDFRHDSGYRLGKQILKQPVRPTAIFVCNGVMTLGVLKAFEELNVRCPGDVALATFDDLAVDSPFHPHLTTVVQPSYEMGARAAGILIDRIEGLISKGPVTIRVAPTLIVRESTHAPIALAVKSKRQTKTR